MTISIIIYFCTEGLPVSNGSNFIESVHCRHDEAYDGEAIFRSPSIFLDCIHADYSSSTLHIPLLGFCSSFPSTYTIKSHFIDEKIRKTEQQFLLGLSGDRIKMH